MFELNDLTLPTPSVRSSYDWLCTQCRRASLSRKTCVCGCSEFIPHVDRRPLLLTKEVRNGIVDLIDQAADAMPDLDIDAQLHCTGEYMPFLSRLLDSAELAAKRQENADSGFRETDLGTEELLALFREMRLPPTRRA